MASTKRYAGIDLGGTKVQVVVVDSELEVVGQSRHATPTSGSPKDVADEMAAAVRDACAESGIKAEDLAGVGVGSPGSVDARTGTVAQAKNLPDWEGSFALGPALEESLGVSISLGNDVGVATLAEDRKGAGAPYRSFLMVAWGTGIGGGLILDGRPWLGRGDAAEIGHMVVKMGGRRCGCGRRGCMEAYAGRASMEAHARKLVERGRKTKLFKIMEERGRDRLTSGVWARALEHDDDLARELIDKAVDALGNGIASAVNLLDVEAVVIGGGLGTRFGDPYVKRIEQEMLPHLFNDQRPPDIVGSTLGDLGGAIGAALLVES